MNNHFSYVPHKYINIWHCCIRTELCRFSGAKIYPGKGIRFVRGDSQVTICFSLSFGLMYRFIWNWMFCLLWCNHIISYEGFCLLFVMILIWGVLFVETYRFSCLLTQNVRGISTTGWSRQSSRGLQCTESSIRRWLFNWNASRMKQ